jgi:hypothetical protein
MTYPVFTNGTVLPASDLNAIGLWLVKSQTVGSGVSSVTVTGAFSADYDNYLITYTGGTSLDTNTTLKLGSAVTGYYGSLIFGNYASATVTGANDNNQSQFSFVGGGAFTSCYIEVLTPFVNTGTEVRARVRYSTVYGTYIGARVTAESFTSFILAPAAGTFTGGTIRVYGYRN